MILQVCGLAEGKILQQWSRVIEITLASRHQQARRHLSAQSMKPTIILRRIVNPLFSVLKTKKKKGKKYKSLSFFLMTVILKCY